MPNLVQWFSSNPLAAFTILLLVILIVPPIFERLRLPGLVGLLVAGLFLGPDGLNLLNSKSETINLLSTIGKIYLMFVAGLEIDLKEFRKSRNRSLGFGISTFLVPMIMGTTVGRVFGMNWNASILIGSLMASHTLLGYPIVKRLGVARHESVAVTIGATIFTDIAALLVLAICVAVQAGNFSPTFLIAQFSGLAIYSAVVLFGFRWLGKEFFRRSGDDQGKQFLFVLLAVFLAAVGAKLVNVEEIVGAFLAGLAVNDVVGRGPVEEKVVFVGSTLFIPFFFVDMGLLLSVSGFVATLSTALLLTLAIVFGLIISKFLAAFIVKFLYRYNWDETLTMWSLSLPQVAATLAAAQVGVQKGVIEISVFNGVVVLMLVTSILGPLITSKFARKLPLAETDLTAIETDWQNSLVTTDAALREDELLIPAIAPHHFTVVVPIYNPYTERYLIEMGALLASKETDSVVVPLSIAKSHAHMDDPELGLALQQGRRLLGKAIAITSEFAVKAQPIIRIDNEIAYGISRTAREQNANLILMGWAVKSGIQARLFGTVTEGVFWSAHCPVAVMRLLDEPRSFQRILVPIKNLDPQALRPVRLGLSVREINQGVITLLHVCNRQTPESAITAFRAELTHLIAQTHPAATFDIQVLYQDDVAQGVIKTARDYDLVILRSVRRRTIAGLAVSDVTTRVINNLNCSIVLFGEPHYGI